MRCEGGRAFQAQRARVGAIRSTYMKPAPPVIMMTRSNSAMVQGNRRRGGIEVLDCGMKPKLETVNGSMPWLMPAFPLVITIAAKRILHLLHFLSSTGDINGSEQRRSVGCTKISVLDGE